MPALQGEDLLDVLRRVAGLLRDSEIDFALGGGLAIWAHGGPASEHDIDMVIKDSDADRALRALAAAGLHTERPPEGWLVKAWDGDVLVDLIFRPMGLEVDDAFFRRCHIRDVHAVSMRVMTVEDVLVTKLLALTEHHLDFGPALEYARSLREQVDWDSLRIRTCGSPFAAAFLCLVVELGIAPEKCRDPIRPSGHGYLRVERHEREEGGLMSQDVLQLLQRDHQAAEALLGRFDATAPADRAEYFCEVVNTLVGHEVAEELVVYPSLRGTSSTADKIADARIGEQSKAEQALAELEDLDPMSTAVTDKFRQVRAAVLAHAEAEETTAFPLLEQTTTAQHREDLGGRYLKAKDSAPTHPHPHAPDTPPANRIVGPVAAVFDRARDAMHRA